MLLEALRKEVLETARTLPGYGLVWMAGGTVCARDPDSGLIVVTPSGVDYGLLEPGDLPVTDLDLRVIEGELRPSVALNLWTGIFRARPDLHAIVHTHSTHATAFSVIGEAIPIVTETMANWFGGPIPVTPYLAVEDSGFVDVPIQMLGSGYAVLLGRHGPIAVGENLHAALERAVTLEEGAKIYFVAQALGKPNLFPPDEAKRSFEFYTERYGQPKSERTD
jgi:ribulose-5-phosphate 4-epimerase/fuculose-1-phosphate aldolase